MNWWISRLPGWVETYGGDAVKILAAIDMMAGLLASGGHDGAPQVKPELPSLKQIKDQIFVHICKATLARKMGETGKIAESDAVAMIESGMTPATAADGKTEAGGQILSNILAWFKANAPTIEADIAALGPLIVQVITLFASFGA